MCTLLPGPGVTENSAPSRVGNGLETTAHLLSGSVVTTCQKGNGKVSILLGKYPGCHAETQIPKQTS